MVSAISGSACSPPECGRLAADAAQSDVHAGLGREVANGGGARCRVDIRPPKRLAALCISRVSVEARSGDEPRPVWIAGRRSAAKGTSSIDGGTCAQVDIRPPKPLEALWFPTVRVGVWPGKATQFRTWTTAAAASRIPVYFNGECEAAITQHACSGVDIRLTNSLSTLCIRTVKVRSKSTKCTGSDVDIPRRNPLAAL